jgi:HSP20 family molecular chaperone IbpA
MFRRAETMQQGIRLLLLSILAGALLPVTVWGYGFVADPGDRHYLSQAGPGGGRQYSGALRIQTGITENGYFVRIYLDGLSPEDIHVSLRRNYLVLQVTQDDRYSMYKPNARGVAQWRMQSRRQLRLPYDADVTRMTSSTKDGIVEIYMPFTASLKWWQR